MKTPNMPAPDPATIAAQQEAKQRAEEERKKAEEAAASTERLRSSGAMGRRSLFSMGEQGYSSKLGS